MMQASKVTHESGRWTITTGQGKTVFRDEQSAAEQIAILQQEIERLKAELAEQITRAEDAEEESATAAGEIERLQHDAAQQQSRVEAAQSQRDEWKAARAESEQLGEEKMRGMAGELDRLQAIVDKLPRDADGILVHSGMRLYKVWNGKVLSGKVFTTMDTSEMRFDVSVCSSSREAAEKAGK